MASGATRRRQSDNHALTYLTRWRMTKASGLLRTRRATMGEIADQVGYDAEAAFSKAFKRRIGTAPGAYRRAGAGPEPRTAS